MMRTEKAGKQFKVAQCIAAKLYAIKIISPVFIHSGGNVVRPTPCDTTEQYESSPETLSLRARHGGRLNEMRETRYFLSKHDWLARGGRTLGMMRGNSKDCAAAAAYLLLFTLSKYLINIKIEIATCDGHTVVIVNRDGCLHDIQTWGDDAFIIDIWMQNHLPANILVGIPTQRVKTVI